MSERNRKVRAGAASASPFYVLGMIGALVYYLEVANGFWAVVLAFLKSAVWPAFFTHDILKFIAR